MGKVKMFNARFRSKYDEEGQSSSLTEPGASMDPRDTAEFQVLDTLITSFKSSFPRDFKDPIGSEGKVDPILYTAHLLPHAWVSCSATHNCSLLGWFLISAMIVLHDPHAEISSTSCLSSERLLAASRAVLDLIYKICATSFDLLLLDHACSVGFLIVNFGFKLKYLLSSFGFYVGQHFYDLWRRASLLGT